MILGIYPGPVLAWCFMSREGLVLELGEEDLGPAPSRKGGDGYEFDQRPANASIIFWGLLSKRPDYVLLKAQIAKKGSANHDGIAAALTIAMRGHTLIQGEWAPHIPVIRSATRSADFPSGKQVATNEEVTLIMTAHVGECMTEPEALAVAVARFGWDKYGVERKTPQSSS